MGVSGRCQNQNIRIFFKPANFILNSTIMTKLLEWISGLIIIIAVWAGIWTTNIGNLALSYPNTTMFWPVYLVILFGLYSIAVIGYRVYTFNNCPEAAEELQREIGEAKEDLKTKGMTF